MHRSTILQWLAQHPQHAESIAAALGYRYHADTAVAQPLSSPVLPSQQSDPLALPPRPDLALYALDHVEPHAAEPAPRHVWQPIAAPAPVPATLGMPMRRLFGKKVWYGICDRLLRGAVPSKRPDFPALTRQLSQGQVIKKLPLLRSRQLCPSLLVVLHFYPRRHSMLAQDFSLLRHAVQRSFGDRAHCILVADDPEHSPDYQQWRSQHPHTQPTILLVGELHSPPWREFAQRHARAVRIVSFGPQAWLRAYPHLVLERHADATQDAHRDMLLAALSQQAIVSHGRLRNLRDALPGASVLDEIAVMRHPDVEPTLDGIVLRGPVRDAWAKRFAALPQRDRLNACMDTLRPYQSGYQRELETLYRKPDIDLPQHCPLLYALAQGVDQRPGENEAPQRFMSYLNQWLSHSQRADLLPLQQAAQRRAEATGDVQPLPEQGLPLAPASWRLFQRGAQLDARVAAYPSVLGVAHPHEHCEQTRRRLADSLPRAGATALRSHSAQRHFARLDMPPWATRFWCDRSGLFAEHHNGLRLVWREAWQPAESDRPQWVSDYGVDSYGFWAEFAVGPVVQRLRWIPPGRFLMGSPEDEPGRYDDETQHWVTLSTGYWIADTATTQALWLQLMGSNPSDFQLSPEHPVDSVSYEDSQQFIAALQQVLVDFTPRFLTEAEFEYATRAGSSTPFWWGSTLSTAQANFDGNFPYHQGDTETCRGHTVPVKSFAMNPFGLYQMHGNVYSWCQDWFGDYASEPQRDPKGPSSGDRRVLRGGSWIRSGRNLRVAYRGANLPSYQYLSVGFRLAGGDRELRATTDSDARRQEGGGKTARQTATARPYFMNDFDHAKFNRPSLFPNAWGTAYGVDSFGYWQAFEITGVRQVMRWIPPGAFVCGSPKEESGREPFKDANLEDYSDPVQKGIVKTLALLDETQHTVHLSEGFWLAESACTQALWRAITHENPSHFQGDDLPVEQVSFEQCEGFIEQLNQQLQPMGLQCTLPSEWQWEYAARAGTSTPFWWGDSADRSQANFNGKYPYGDGKKGEKSNSTQEVLRYAPNPLGLYQVHGNVWEWTRTWAGAYPSGPQYDPIGPSSGAGRVLRGGSWIDNGQFLRAAHRNAYPPSNQIHFVGLRLAGGDQ